MENKYESLSVEKKNPSHKMIQTLANVSRVCDCNVIKIASTQHMCTFIFWVHCPRQTCWNLNTFKANNCVAWGLFEFLLGEMNRSGKNTYFDKIQLVIYHHEKDENYRHTAAMLQVPHSTVADIIKRYVCEDRLDLHYSTGWPRLLNEYEERSLVRKIKVNPKLNAPKLTSKLFTEHKKKVSTETVRWAIRRAGYNSRVARKKPFINEINRKKRLKFANELLRSPLSIGIMWFTVRKVNLTCWTLMVELWFGDNQITN